MKRLVLILMLAACTFAKAQTSISTLNFLQAGYVPQFLKTKDKKHYLSNSGLAFNFSSFNTNGFVRADATWLIRKFLHGNSTDTAVKDSTFKYLGMDLPVLTLTVGRNLVANSRYSIGLGVNLDSRALFADPATKRKAVYDAFNFGVVLGLKIKITSYLTYSGFIGYDYMFSNNSKISDGNQYYAQNNFSFLLGSKIGINIQPDFTFKQFNAKGIGTSILVNKNMKVGISFAIP